MYKRVLIALAARGSQAIITVSEFSHVQLLAKFPSLEGRVFVIHNGVEIVNCHRISNAKDDRPFLLFVGTLETRKNLVRLIQAFRLMRQHYKLPHRLVLAGKPGHGWQAIEEAINENGVRDAIEVRGYVREEKLGDLYHAATAVIYPSLYEGFGLPILEGMAHGTPVACSNTTSLPEVGGNAVIYFNPHDVEEMAAAIERVLRSPSLQAELREKGLKRASQFTWEECARKHIEVYRKVLSQ
jgi:glycosyltransferase involved in cell wall biosynthesis